MPIESAGRYNACPRCGIDVTAFLRRFEVGVVATCPECQGSMFRPQDGTKLVIRK